MKTVALGSVPFFSSWRRVRRRLLAALLLAILPAARAQDFGTLTTLYSFTLAPYGPVPSAPLLQGSDGNFYGTTLSGGTNRWGTIFRIAPDGSYTVLYNFTGNNTPGGDGGSPVAALIEGRDGNFYGMTTGRNTTIFPDGSGGDGTIFKITPAGALTTLHSFANDDNGHNPGGALVQGSDGNFYGTTFSASVSNVQGTVFQLTPAGVFTTLHRFTNGSDGALPSGTLLLGCDGDLYGTTLGLQYTNQNNPTKTYGTVFKITTAGVLTPLHMFTLTDGASPNPGLGPRYGRKSLWDHRQQCRQEEHDL